MGMLNIGKDLEKEIEKIKNQTETVSVGKILKVSDGVALLVGLREAKAGELLLFPGKISGVALNLEENQIGAIILGDYLSLKEGDEVRCTGRLLSIPVANSFLGRVINPLGLAIDGKLQVSTDKFYPIEKIAPGVTWRQPVAMPLQTGIKAIDSMIPIGRGQRELIIGDRGTGKTALVVDTIINQKGKDMVCIYVAIGQKTSRVAQVVDVLDKAGALDHTIVISAGAAEPVSLQFFAPYAGCALGEFFMDQGKDALVIFDDLSKHAWSYRQISLILRRPSGREAYPGDIFYLHSRLLERACRLSKEHGGGSLTALPIVETQAGDISAYIPTNIISITDGQIFLENDLFYAGIRPAINVGLSVSRVGGNAQIKAMKQVAGRLRLDLAQYREMAAFSQLSSDLDAATKAQIERGSKMTEILKQPQFAPVPVVEQILIIWAGTNGYLDDLELKKAAEFEKQYLYYFHNQESALVKEIEKEQKLSDKMILKIKKATEKFISMSSPRKRGSRTDSRNEFGTGSETSSG